MVANRKSIEAKIADFALAGASRIHVVLDFDRTLTIKKPGAQDEVTTWHILCKHLPASGRLYYQRLFDKYRALELSGDMTQKDATDWWSSILNLFVEHRINLTEVEEDFLDKANIRPGVAELFKFCADNNIPTVILSAGIRDVIDIWCRKYDIKPSLVISTALVLDDNNRITGWEKNTLIHVLNKSEVNHPELLTIRSQRPNALLVGDSLDDAHMAHGEENVIRVRILDPRPDEIDNSQEQNKTLKKFDALIMSGTLNPLHNSIKLII